MTSFKPRRLFLSSLLAAMGLAVPLAPAWAQPFPSKPVRIVIGFPPGGGIDIVARTIAPKLSEALGQPVIIDNKPGVAGVLGTNLVAKAPADGHTIFFGTTGNISINPVFMPNLPFNMDKDFTPLMLVASLPFLVYAHPSVPVKNLTELVASLPFLVYAHPSVPVKNLSELVASAKANPGKVNFYSSGNGGLPHLTGELLNNVAGIQTVHIAYKGSAPGMNDLIGGQVQLGYDTVAIGLQHIKTGRLRALATTGPKRLAILPDVPSTSEFAAGLEAVNWYGMVVPAGTPRDVILRLNREITKVLEMPDIKEKLVSQGIDPAANSPEEFGEFMKSEAAKWARVIRAANIKPDS